MTIIEELEEQVEALRQRVEAYEALLGEDAKWEAAVSPLTLYQTRLMRIVERKDVTGGTALRLLSSYYPNTSQGSLDTALVYIRRALPEHIAPRVRRTKYDTISVPDREALKAFLTGNHPVGQRVRRLAA